MIWIVAYITSFVLFLSLARTWRLRTQISSSCWAHFTWSCISRSASVSVSLKESNSKYILWIIYKFLFMWALVHMHSTCLPLSMYLHWFHEPLKGSEYDYLTNILQISDLRHLRSDDHTFPKDINVVTFVKNCCCKEGPTAMFLLLSQNQHTLILRP